MVAQSVDLGSKWVNISIIEKPTRCVENLESLAISAEGSRCRYFLENRFG